MAESVFDINNPGPNMGAVEARNINDNTLETRMVGVVNGNLAIPITIDIPVTTGSSSVSVFNANAPYTFEIIDVIIQPRGASSNGTMKLNNGSNDITNAIACAVATDVARVGTINSSYSTIAKGGSLVIVCAGDTPANTIGLVTIVCIKR